MRRLATFLLTLVVCWTCAWAANTSGAVLSSEKAADWERYTSAGEEFSVQMPKTPGVAAISRPPLMSVVRRGALYTAYEDGTVYFVLSFDNTGQQEDLQVFFSEFQQYGVFNAGATYERELTLDGFKGKQYRVKSDKNDIAGVAQFYRTKRRVYIFEAVGEARSQPAIERFLASVALAQKPKGKDIMSLDADTEELPKESDKPALKPSPDTANSQAATTPERPFTPKEVLRKAVLVTRPEPQYTEDARQNAIAGTVILKAIFSASGTVTNIRAVAGLPYGLTEQAIAAARQLRFIPAIKDGRYVSQYVQIEYNFNLY